MDKIYFKLTEEILQCGQLANALAYNCNLANALAHNCNYKPNYYEEITKSHMDNLYALAHELQQALFRTVRQQCAGEPSDERIDLTL